MNTINNSNDITISNSLFKGLSDMMSMDRRRLLCTLSVKLHWSEEKLQEALEAANLTASVGVKTSRTKGDKTAVKIHLPYTGPACFRAGDCHGLKCNNNLYTQCTSQPTSGTAFCKACIKVATAATDDISVSCAKPFLTIQDRMKVGEFEFTIEKPTKAGFKMVKPDHYTKYMAKHNLTTQQVLNEAIRLGLQIDAEHFNAPAIIAKKPRAKKQAKDAADVPIVPPKNAEILIDAEDMAKLGPNKPEDESETKPTTTNDDDDNNDIILDSDSDSDDDDLDEDSAVVEGFDPDEFDYQIMNKTKEIKDVFGAVKLYKCVDAKTSRVWLFARKDADKDDFCSQYPIGEVVLNKDSFESVAIPQTFQAVKNGEMTWTKCKVIAVVKAKK